MSGIDVSERDYFRIEHMKEYCVCIDELVIRFGKDYNILVKDTAYFLSVSMILMQIGELSVKLSDSLKEATANIISWNDIRRARNLFAHDYLNMSKRRIWDMLLNDIPRILALCEDIINEYGDKYSDD